MSDQPILELDTPVRRLEVAAMKAYREAYPTGPAWQDLHRDTRVMWLANEQA